MNVVILAAGQGKRMCSDLPKVLHRLGGQPLLAHVLETARALNAMSAADAGKICIVYGHGGEMVRQALDAPGLVWVRQEPQLGTGHAVSQALPFLDEGMPTLVLYGDVPLIGAATLRRLLAAAGDGLGVLTAVFDDPVGYGRILRDADGRVRRIVEHRDASADERAVREINTGFMAAPTAAFRRWLPALGNDNAQREYYLTDIVGLAIGESMAVATAQPEANWEVLGVNSKPQLAELERIYQRNNAQRLMESGVTLADPERIDVRGQLDCGRDVSIDVNCVFEGHVVLGDGVEVGAHCVLKNAVIGAGSRIAPFSHLEEAEAGDNSRIGPYARLRPGTRLGADVHIGNFVEVKNSRIADGSKANHLAYLGDATIGRNVNVGAGAITCNYDGASKHRTVIEDDVFIGSDTQLVAPVTVGRGATLGAGTTLTKDAPPDKLTLTRVKQTTVPGWKRPVKKK
ncbi:MAG: bifunctional UDP-N-acetylglucosamine diphosphorylase/glucosamine-1-phosphate N-acetyltransferase GlmU [Zoogloeaceae bacterium]|jgi:bifunctional UDP-N-acetylglucosamine pyrophosphorylase/glucosamine-1-phosphate N-acetyltransferase|nr:bifunctional UDP-N-acetylglucosamine diphosphorylase/glucosamine-1-phosphate N-acetyltransferase GlmU [Zoogloeaceae bacterium]